MFRENRMASFRYMPVANNEYTLSDGHSYGTKYVCSLMSKTYTTNKKYT